MARDGYVGCADERRAGDLLASTHPLNGLDYVEFVRDLAAPVDRRFRLDAAFLKTPPPALVGAPQAFAVIGGVRVVGIRVLDVESDAADTLRLHVFVDREGDFSTYILRVDDPALDGDLAEACFSFKAGCPTRFDCRRLVDCPPEELDEPALDYLAKDYQSFRRLMLDLIPTRNPGWIERLPADLGMALVDLFAYVGDYLSYYQDAAGTEGYLDTCLHRISAARHARLIDYRMHHGRNAVTYIHFIAEPGPDRGVPAGAKLLTRVSQPLRGESDPPGLVLPEDADFDGDSALADAVVFETTAFTRVTDLHNELRIHTWGNTECCLARGAREAFLYGVPTAGADPNAFRPELRAGDYLLLEEVRSAVTGTVADANPRRRQVVRLVSVEETEDPVYRQVLIGRQLTPRSGNAQASLLLLRVTWGVADELRFPLCLSADTPETGPIDPVAIARGNVAPADHGRTVERQTNVVTDVKDSKQADRPPSPALGRWPLPWRADAPLTHQAMPDEPQYAADNRLLTGRHDLERDVRQVMPAIVLTLAFPGSEEERWSPVPHLLDSGPYDQHFVAEIDNQGAAVLRFGDDRYGRRPLGVERVAARFRVGAGRDGNIGAGTLVHIHFGRLTAAELIDPTNPGAGPMPLAEIARIYQPLAALLGTDFETVEEVRQQAPEAFRAIQFRAVTEADWQEVALRHAGVAAAKARFRWTGSWHTVFVAIHPVDAEHLVRLAGGGAALAADFAVQMIAYLRRFKLAGYDLTVRAAQYVPLEIAVRICIAPGHFRGDVLEEVARVLSNRSFADGTRGMFHPLELAFGEPVFLSRLYAAVEAVEGVDSATVTVFKRYWEIQRDQIERGLIPLGEMEIARLDNDSNFPESGVVELTAVGGQ